MSICLVSAQIYEVIIEYFLETIGVLSRHSKLMLNPGHFKMLNWIVFLTSKNIIE